MFNRIWTTFKAKAFLLPHLFTVADWKRCGGSTGWQLLSVLSLLCVLPFPSHPWLGYLCTFQDWIKKREREEIVKVLLVWHRHSPSGQPLGWQNSIPHSFLWLVFCEFWGVTLALEHSSVSVSYGLPTISSLALAICGHLLQPGIESGIALDWLHIWPRSHTLPCPTVGGYLACSQCSLIPLPLPPPPAHLIWSVSLTSPFILQTQGGTFEVLQAVSLTHLSHLV